MLELVDVDSDGECIEREDEEETTALCAPSATEGATSFQERLPLLVLPRPLSESVSTDGVKCCLAAAGVKISDHKRWGTGKKDLRSSFAWNIAYTMVRPSCPDCQCRLKAICCG